MRAIVATILVIIIAFVVAESSFTTFVKHNKDKLRQIHTRFSTCWKSCKETKESGCLSRCVRPRGKDDVDEEMSALFDEILADEQIADEGQSDSQSGRSTNSAGVNLIKEFEGFESCVYLDVAGNKTIGYGHLIKSGESFTCISRAEGETLLKKDLGTAESCVSRSVTTSISDNQFGALVSFTFNLGCGNLQSSTLLKKVNARDPISDICYEFSKWNKAGGKVVPGLTRRREAECNLYKK